MTTSPGGRSVVDHTHGWTINNDTGITTNGWHFEAKMNYRIIAHEDGYRVTTRGYLYRLAREGEDVWRHHWHPLGRSSVAYPHLHANFDGGDQLTNVLEEHLPTGRMSLEGAVRWAILTGYPPVLPDWDERLTIAEKDHLIHRTWGGTEAPHLYDD